MCIYSHPCNPHLIPTLVILAPLGVRPHPLRRQADQGPPVLGPDLPPADPLQTHDMGRRQGSPGQQEGRDGEHHGVYQSGKSMPSNVHVIYILLSYVYAVFST